MMGKGITKKSIEIYELLKSYKREKIFIQPSFQREFVWKIKQQKNLIKSVLKGIPLPYFYFAKIKNNCLEVIDGQQRLTTMFGYINPNYIEQAKEKLSKEFMKDSLKFDDQSYLKKEVIKKLKKTKIDAVIIDESKWDINKKYEMFEILNQGGTRLTAQELRHCVFERVNSELNKYLKRGARKLDKLIGKKEHLYNEELVLRFFVIRKKKSYGGYKVSSELEPKKLENLKKDEIEHLFKEFTKFINRIREIYPKPKTYCKGKAKPIYFKTLKEGIRQKGADNLEGYTYSQDINQALFHILSYYLLEYNNNQFNRISHKKKRGYLLNFLKKDLKAKTLTGAGTDNPHKMEKQIKLFKKIFISNMGDYTRKERRNISPEEKDTLLRNFDYCYLCYNKIRDLNKVEPEHIGPYKKGYMSKFHNILLACKSCNGKKLGKDLEEYRDSTTSLKRRLKHKKNIRQYLKELKKWNSNYKLKWYKQLVHFAEEDKKKRN